LTTPVIEITTNSLASKFNKAQDKQRNATANKLDKL